MTLADVLAKKGKTIVTLWTNHDLADAVRIFDERAVSSVVIVDREGWPLGLVTDRDVVHAVARHGSGALALGVEQVMSSPAPSCSPQTTVAQAMSRMTEQRVRHLVIIDGETMTGVVSIGDLVKVKLDEAAIEGRVLRDLALSRIAAE